MSSTSLQIIDAIDALDLDPNNQINPRDITAGMELVWRALPANTKMRDAFVQIVAVSLRQEAQLRDVRQAANLLERALSE